MWISAKDEYIFNFRQNFIFIKNLKKWRNFFRKGFSLNSLNITKKNYWAYFSQSSGDL